MSFVSLRGFAKSFGESRVFADVDLDVAQGSMCILLGPSGCGKTTLLRAIAGLVQPDSGRLTIDGQDATALPPQSRGIAMMFQHYALFPNMTVRENLAFGLQQRRLPRAAIQAKVDGMLATMELEGRADAKPDTLSGGQKQRVALARALVLEPRLLLLDEPLSALDAQIRRRLRDELKRLQRRTGLTAILVTHDQEEALVLGDQIAVMARGHIVQAGAARDVYDRPSTRFVAGFIGEFNVMEPAVIERIFGVATQAAWAIHPEALDMTPAADLPDGLALAHTARGTVMEARVHGPVLRYLVEVSGAELRVDMLNRSSVPLLAAGTPVTLHLDPMQVRELPD